MGYQESYLTIRYDKRFTKQRFEKLVNRVKELGYEYYNKYGTYPVEIITFNKANCWFKKGQKAIYFVGDRFLQRDVTHILRYGNPDDYPDEMFKTNEDLELILWDEFKKCDEYYAQIIFTEYVDAEGVWEDAGKPLYVTHEKFKW